MDIQAIILNLDGEPDRSTLDALFTLRSRGYRLAANKKINACDVFVEATEKRDALLLAAQSLGVAPSECAAAQRDEQSIVAAKSSGMTAIGVGKAKNCVYADFSVNDVGELAELFM